MLIYAYFLQKSKIESFLMIAFSMLFLHENLHLGISKLVVQYTFLADIKKKPTVEVKFFSRQTITKIILYH